MSYKSHCNSCGQTHGWREPCYEHEHKVPVENHVHYHQETASACPGLKGEPGLDGARGEKGDQGADGSRGPAGRDGVNGEPGPAGPVGPQGIQGPEGNTGAQGIQGPEGPQGIQGVQGEQGETGKSCSIDAALSADGTQLKVDWYSDGDFVGSETLTAPVGPQGPAGTPGTNGINGTNGTNGIDGSNGADGQPGPTGPSGFISCDFDEQTNCYDVVALLQNGVQKTMQLGGCVTLLACGYAGSPKCATNATGTITQLDANNATVDVTYIVDGGTLTSQLIFSDTIASNSTVITNPRFFGGRFCVDVETTGKLDFSNLYDKAGLPTTPEGCTSPLSGDIQVDGIVLGGGQATQINKTTGGTVESSGWDNIGSGNYNVNSDDNIWTDNIDNPQLFGGIPGAVQGSNFGFIVDTFKDNVQRFSICESVCYYQPIEYETDVSGNPIPGTGLDANGNVYTGQVTDLITGVTVSI